MHLLKMLLRCIDAVGCIKKRHAPRCIHKMQVILSVLALCSFGLLSSALVVSTCRGLGCQVYVKYMDKEVCVDDCLCVI